MLVHRTLALIAAVAICAVHTSAGATWTVGDDAGPFDWSIVQTGATLSFVNAAGYTDWIYIKAFDTSASLQSDHCETSTNVRLHHQHRRGGFPAISVFDDIDITVTEAQVVALWDYAFKFTGGGHSMTGGAGATPEYNCYAYALQEASSGTYNYWLNDTAFQTALRAELVYNGDCLAYNDCDACFMDGSVLLYTNEDHATYLVNAIDEPPGDECTPASPCGWPITLRWKWRSSGIYTRTKTMSPIEKYTRVADSATPTRQDALITGVNTATEAAGVSWSDFIYSVWREHVWGPTARP